MDAVIVLVVAGCAVLGTVWGAVRLATLVAAVAAGILAGRWAGPVAAQLAGTASRGGSARMVTIAAVALAAALLVWLAGKGIRRALKALHLGWADRAAGLAIGAAAAILVLALLFGLAATGGHAPSSPWAARLAQAGQTFLAVQNLSASKASPSNTPRTPTSSGQQPH
ncbi:MAG TPA: CvpA family protein [Thermoanaerobaculaceae bacterium]|nr:CvpA family protein [Thermoanaerobaculaceae bacterium]